MRPTSLLIRIAFLAAIVLAATSWYRRSAMPAQTSTAVMFSPVATTLRPNPILDWIAGIEGMEMRGDYSALERLAVAFRHVNIRFAGGEPKITAFYAALGDFTGCGCTSERLSFVTYGAKLHAITAWMAAIPHSPTAAVAMAKLLRQYAWTRRGHQFATETDEPRLGEFADITRRSVAYLQQLDPKRDPAIYVGLLSAARGSDDGREDMDAIFPEAVAAFPSYYPYYENEADMLQERWFGAPGEAGRFLASLPDLGDIGLVAYADAVGRLDESNSTSNLQHIFKIDWQVLRRAFDTRRRIYGTDTFIRNEEMKLAVVCGDRAYAAMLLQQIGENWAPKAWQRRASFDQAVAWIRGGTGSPPSFD